MSLNYLIIRALKYMSLASRGNQNSHKKILLPSPVVILSEVEGSCCLPVVTPSVSKDGSAIFNRFALPLVILSNLSGATQKPFGDDKDD